MMYNPDLNLLTNDLSNLATVFDKPILERLLHSFSVATKLHVTITDAQGNPWLSSRQGDSCFCAMIKDSPAGLERCKGVYERAGRQATKWNEPYIFRCHAGLTAWVCPIMLNNVHAGNIVCGQVRMLELSNFFFQEIKDLTKDLPCESDKLIAAVKQLEVVSPAQVQAASDMLFITANYLAQGGAGLLNYRHQLRMISSWLWKESNQLRDVQPVTEGCGQQFHLQLQDRIITEIRKANMVEARNLLNQLALQFFNQSRGQIEIIKALGIEFISFLTRLATESGVNFEESYKFSMLKFKELDESDTVEKVMLWLLSVGNQYLEILSRENTNDNLAIINKAISYTQNHCAEPTLTVKEIAEAIYLSPSYLSHVFKKEKGYSLSEYLNRIRIDQAKILLRLPEMNHTEIAEKIGYVSRSYFCKMFKMRVGISPNEYRHSLNI